MRVGKAWLRSDSRMCIIDLCQKPRRNFWTWSVDWNLVRLIGETCIVFILLIVGFGKGLAVSTVFSEFARKEKFASFLAGVHNILASSCSQCPAPNTNLRIRATHHYLLLSPNMHLTYDTAGKVACWCFLQHHLGRVPSAVNSVTLQRLLQSLSSRCYRVVPVTATYHLGSPCMHCSVETAAEASVFACNFWG